MRRYDSIQSPQNPKPPFPEGGAAKRRRVVGLCRSQHAKRSSRSPLRLRQSQPIIILTFALFLLYLLPIRAFAAENCYLEYTPRSNNSSVFYIDVFSSLKITAAVFELSFDESAVSYYSVSAADSSASVRDHSENGKVTAAFAESNAVSGKLCRFSFKALKVGSTDFVLRMRQACGADRKLLSGWSDCTLSVKLGKEDIVSDSSLKRTDKTSSGASASASKRGGKSDLNIGEDEENPSPDIFDMRRNDNPLKWILIGAGITLFIGALILTGVLIGRKSKQTTDKKEKPGEEIPAPENSSDEQDT